MRGYVVQIGADGRGIISGDDGHRYSFTAAQWSSSERPEQGMYVDFDSATGEPSGIVVLSPPSGTAAQGGSGGKSKIAAALLAFFLGGLGIHKFYLGYTGVGVIYLLLTLTLIGALISGPLSLIDFVIYLTKSDQDFDRVYVKGRRPWF